MSQSAVGIVILYFLLIIVHVTSCVKMAYRHETFSVLKEGLGLKDSFYLTTANIELRFVINVTFTHVSSCRSGLSK